MGERARRAHSKAAKTHRGPLLLAAGLLVGFWVIFVWTGSLDEDIVGAVAVVASLAFTFAVAKTTGLSVRFKMRDVLQAWRIPWYIVTDVCQVTMVFVKDVLHIAPAGDLFRVCGFDASRHDPVRLGRSTLAVMYTTASPSFIVIGIDPEQSRMLFHQIQSSEMPTMTRSLGARG